jgi:hypothetical protein
MGIITVQEADDNLDQEVFSAWFDFDAPFKQNYIDQASAFVQLRFCPNTTTQPFDWTNFDWTDNTTWPTGTIGLIAQYALAVGNQTLYPNSAAGSDSPAPVKRKTVKAGSLEQTLEYAQPDLVVSKNVNKQISDQMLALGFLRCPGTANGGLTRV